MNENMTIKEIRAELNALTAAMTDKGVMTPSAEVFIEQDNFRILLRCSYIKPTFDGDSCRVFSTLEDAHKYIAKMPSPEDVVTKEYLTRVASAVDYATENSIADEYVTPLRGVTCAMTDNLLTKESDQ